jgi:AcrR family transcriptional regulator
MAPRKLSKQSKPARALRARKKSSRVSLDTKARPRQKRAHTTYETILATAGALLEEVGVERLSTNLICEKAGITPPALYRYFPNKYALLKELGARLMAAQDEAVFAYIETYRDLPGTVEQRAERRRAVQEKVNAITRAFPGGAWVMRALRAIPTLREVRVASREAVAERIFETLLSRYPDADRKDLRVAATLSVEVMYASTELIIDQPELDTDRINREMSYMVALYQESFADPARKTRLRNK